MLWRRRWRGSEATISSWCKTLPGTTRYVNSSGTCVLILTCSLLFVKGFPDSSVGKESACNAGDPGSIPGSGRSPGEGIDYPLQYSWASLVAQLVKNTLAMRETWVWSLGWEDPLEKGKATHSSILAWRIPWTIVHGVAKSRTWLNDFRFTPLPRTGIRNLVFILLTLAACVPDLNIFSSIGPWSLFWFLPLLDDSSGAPEPGLWLKWNLCVHKKGSKQLLQWCWWFAVLLFLIFIE